VCEYLYPFCYRFYVVTPIGAEGQILPSHCFTVSKK
jgi:hypothetical protein